MPGKKQRSRQANDLKKLYSRRAWLTDQVATLSIDEDRDQTRFRQLCDQLSAVNRAIAASTDGGLVVTEHAIVRYLQRVYGLDLEKICAEIAPPDVQAMAKNLGDGKYPIGKGARVRVVDNKVLTVWIG